LLFNSFEFLLFFLLVFALYYCALFKDKQVGLLIVASLIFYAWSATTLTLLLLGSIGLNTVTSLLVHRVDNRKVALCLAVAGVICNVLLLCLFKYAGLLTQSFQQLFHTHNSLTAVLLQIPLPIGISFYTFEGISLLVDTYKGLARPLPVGEHARRTALFMSFFPHLIAGPILRARDFYPQVQEQRFHNIRWERAFHYLIL